MNKFIINDGFLIMGDVRNHLELARDHTTTKGGGMWAVDHENKKVYLFGGSLEYGAAKTDDIRACIEEGKISDGLKGFRFYRSYSRTLEEAEKNSTEIQFKKSDSL